MLDRHPLAADAALAALVLVLSLSTLSGGVAALLVTLALALPLAARRKAPVLVFAAVMVGCAAELAFVDEFLAATGAALVALYTLVAYAPRRVAAAGFALTLAGAVPYALRDDYFAHDSAVVTWLLLAAQLTVAAVLGDRRRGRLRERAQLAIEFEREAALGAAAERARIARELHDVVAHSLSVVIAQADGGRYEPAAAQTALDTIATTAREALAEMRRALGTLGDAPLGPQPGAADVGTLVERTRAAGLRVELCEEGARRPLGPGAGLAVYRVTQEALTNVLKHAGPGASAWVTLRWEPAHVTVVVRDDGTGTPAGSHGGRGLTGMRERVEPRGGTLTAGPRPEGGFEVRAAIPVGP